MLELIADKNISILRTKMFVYKFFFDFKAAVLMKSIEDLTCVLLLYKYRGSYMSAHVLLNL